MDETRMEPPRTRIICWLGISLLSILNEIWGKVRRWEIKPIFWTKRCLRPALLLLENFICLGLLKKSKCWVFTHFQLPVIYGYSVPSYFQFFFHVSIFTTPCLASSRVSSLKLEALTFLAVGSVWKSRQLPTRLSRLIFFVCKQIYNFKNVHSHSTLYDTLYTVLLHCGTVYVCLCIATGREHWTKHIKTQLFGTRTYFPRSNSCQTLDTLLAAENIWMQKTINKISIEEAQMYKWNTPYPFPRPPAFYLVRCMSADWSHCAASCAQFLIHIPHKHTTCIEEKGSNSVNWS